MPKPSTGGNGSGVAQRRFDAAQGNGASDATLVRSQSERHRGRVNMSIMDRVKNMLGGDSGNERADLAADIAGPGAEGSNVEQALEI